jgi:hypothetical protein
LPGYEKWIKGDYYQNSELRKAITDKKREILDVLREGYPNPLSARDLKEWKREGRKKIKENSAQTYPPELVKANVITRWKEEEDTDSRIEVTKYYFEDYNYLFNQKQDFRFPFAPGYVQYTKNFLNTYDRIRNKEVEDKIYELLTDFLMDAVRKTKRAHRADLLCKNCGYNHETRDFIRAALLHLIDELECNRRFIEFMRNEGIINEITYKELMTMAGERQFALSNRNENQASEAWFDGMSSNAKKMIERILIEKPEMTKEQLMNLLDDKKRKIGGGYLTDQGAAFLVGADLGISLGKS